MADTAADVPLKYDVVINGNGFIFASPSSAYSADPEAVHGFTPQFVTRQNVQGNFGDNQQDFWMTYSQNDWTLGEQQKFYRMGEATSTSRYWLGSNVDKRVAGQVSIRSTVAEGSAAASVVAMASESPTLFSTSTTVYSIDSAASISSKGAHGLGRAPSLRGMATDNERNLFLSSTGAGTVGVRKMTSAAVFSTFSANGADVLAFLNNTLYGLRQNTSSDLVRWDTAGTLTSLFTFKGADGGVTQTGDKLYAMVPFGGKLAILTRFLAAGPELWIYDGTAPSVVARFPKTFAVSTALVEANGVLFIGGTIPAVGGSVYQAIYYYANGTTGLLWRSETTGGSLTTLEAYNNTLVFGDSSNPVKLLQYDLQSGGVTHIATTSLANAPNVSASCDGYAVFSATGQATVSVFPSSSVATTATIQTSLFDGESSLTKYFKSVKVDADIPTGATVDLAYQVADVAGSYTNAQTGAVAGTEYALGVSGRSISIKVTLNKGSSTSGPVLKRIYVRAAPVQDQFRKEAYVLDCTGRDGQGMVALRDGSLHPLDGKEQATNLRTAAMSSTPISVTDEFGTYTGLVDLDGFELRRVGLEQYHALVPIRQV